MNNNNDQSGGLLPVEKMERKLVVSSDGFGSVCFKCVGDGWLTGEWDECPTCYGTGKNLSDETRRIYRVRRAERESAWSAKRLDAAEAEHAKNMAELAAAQGALFEANQSLPNIVVSNAMNGFNTQTGTSNRVAL